MSGRKEEQGVGGFENLQGPLLSWQPESWIQAAGRENMKCFVPVISGVVHIKKKNSLSFFLSAFHSTTCSPIRLLSRGQLT